MLKIYEGVENHILYKVVDDVDIIKDERIGKTYLIVRTVFKQQEPFSIFNGGCFGIEKVEVKLIAQGV